MKHLTDANKDKLIAFLRSRAAAGEASLKSWGRDQRPQIPGSLVEEIADALVAEGKATCEIKTHGGRVWRAAVVEPTAPAPEPDIEGAAEEEPVVVAGDAEPAQDIVKLLRCDFDAIVNDRDSARDAFRYLRKHLSQALDLPDGGPISGIIDWVRFLVAGAKARAERPTHYQAPDLDPGAIAHYLLELPSPRWNAISEARQQLAEGRTLAERATRLQESALATVEGILTAPAGEAPVAEEPPPPPSGEQPTVAEEPPADTALGRVLQWLRRRDDARARQAAEALSLSVPRASAALVTLTRKGLVVRVGTGLYRAIRAKEAA